jgi:hypothetical protein
MTLWISGTVAVCGVILLLLYRGIWRRFPLFFAYSVWVLLANAVVFVLFEQRYPGYAQAYLVDMAGDSVLLFGVLVELGWSILRPLHGSLWGGTRYVVGALILLLGVIIWPFAVPPVSPGMPAVTMLILHLQQTFYVVRIVVFLALAGSSHFLSIGWRDRELQIATGLGATSVVSLAVAMLRVYPSMRTEIHMLNELVIVTFLASQLYWIFSFAQKEQERRQMTPQMQSVLLAVAGAARSTREAIAPPGAGNPKAGSKL